MTFLKNNLQDLFVSEKNSALALKDHSQIPLVIDILSRRENHHVVLNGIQSQKVKLAFLESVALHLNEGSAPKSLKDIEFIYFNRKHFSMQTSEKVALEFMKFAEEINSAEKKIIFVTDHFDDYLENVLANENWRVIILNDSYEAKHLNKVKLTYPNDKEIIALLKCHKQELESFHHVLIPEETFPSAFALTGHYLASDSTFDTALELLDSAAARASSIEHLDSASHMKPLVTTTTLTHVISSWTRIPISHLHNNTFQAKKFIEALQRRVYGQDAAAVSVGSILQHAYLKLQDKSGPLCSFLFAGLPETGKTTAALTMAEHLFGHQSALLRINLTESCHSISEVKIISEEGNKTLLEAIKQTPYAIVLIEDIQQASPATLQLFKNILVHGFAIDDEGKQCSFNHSIIVLTTTLGSERIASLTQAPALQDSNKTMDLMQLVLSDLPQDNTPLQPHLSSQEIGEELISALEGFFSENLLQHLNVIPFLPLDYAALEKIIRLKLKLFSKRLETDFGIELNCAPEVIKFLAHEALWRKPQSKPLEKLLEQHLYSAVANEILAYADDKNRSKRLLLRLNDDGQLLRCEFINALGSAVYSVT